MFSLDRVAYSIRNSYLAIDYERDCLVIKTVRNGGCRPIFKIPFLAEKPKISFCPWELTVKTSNGTYNFSLGGKEGVYIKGEGAELKVEYCEPENVYNSNYVINELGGIRIADVVNDGFTRIIPLQGELSVEAPTNAKTEQRKYLHKRLYINVGIIPNENGEFEAVLEQFHDNAFASTLVDVPYLENVEKIKKDYVEWTSPIVKGDTDKEESAYVLWSNIVPADKNFKAEAIVMSKAGMSRVWSWDNCFNSIALADSHFELSLNQFLLPFRFMNDLGRIPDAVSHTTEEWTHIKPPIHGWAYTLMMDKNPKFARNEYLSQVYFYIKRNTDWWLNFQGEIPAYFHGNDSGADNATCFDHAEHVETPELQAFLALQCKFLYQTAEKLGLKFDAVHYKKVFEELSARANDRYFDGKLFVIDVNTGEKIYSNALMPLKVIVLGDKLSKELRDYVVDQIKTRYLGNYGVASEAIDSPEYMTDGYWRGPVWGPDQIILVSALKDIGETNLAETIKNRYKKACVEFGLGENTDVHTGKALRCKNYCWTACAVLL